MDYANTFRVPNEKFVTLGEWIVNYFTSWDQALGLGTDAYEYLARDLDGLGRGGLRGGALHAGGIAFSAVTAAADVAIAVRTYVTTYLGWRERNDYLSNTLGQEIWFAVPREMDEDPQSFGFPDSASLRKSFHDARAFVNKGEEKYSRFYNDQGSVVGVFAAYDARIINAWRWHTPEWSSNWRSTVAVSMGQVIERERWAAGTLLNQQYKLPSLPCWSFCRADEGTVSVVFRTPLDGILREDAESVFRLPADYVAMVGEGYRAFEAVGLATDQAAPDTTVGQAALRFASARASIGQLGSDVTTYWDDAASEGGQATPCQPEGVNQPDVRRCSKFTSAAPTGFSSTIAWAPQDPLRPIRISWQDQGQGVANDRLTGKGRFSTSQPLPMASGSEAVNGILAQMDQAYQGPGGPMNGEARVAYDLSNPAHLDVGLAVRRNA